MKYYTIKLTENQLGALLGALRNESSDEDGNYYEKHYYAIAKKAYKAGFVNGLMETDGIAK